MQAQVGVGASWELDFWGKYRRAIESADANLVSSIASYDNALVTLTGDVSNTYVLIRTLEELVQIARENVEIQKESLKIAQARFQGGVTSDRDVQQAIAELKNTEATVFQLDTQLRQAKNALCTLLGLPPSHLDDVLSGASGIPKVPSQVAVGIPADLLRRRPDIRRAEYLAVAQCAQIGVAKADLYPAFSLSGNFGFLASDTGQSQLGDLTSWKSRTGSIGPAFQWNVLNYGQITNQVRLQDAKFQEALVSYQNIGAPGATGGGKRSGRLPQCPRTSRLAHRGRRGGQAKRRSGNDSVHRGHDGFYYGAHGSAESTQIPE